MASKDSEANRRYQREYRERMTEEERRDFDKYRYQKYKEKYNLNSNKWAEENPHKQQASTHQSFVKRNYPEEWQRSDIETKELAEWLKLARGAKCFYCGEEAFHIDHTQPLSLGGPHKWSNIELVCKWCNKAKNNRSKEDFLTWIKKIANA